MSYPLSGFNIQSSCCICALVFVVGLLFTGDEPVTLPCQHVAHLSCVTKAVTEKNQEPCKWYIYLFLGFIKQLI